MAPPQNIEAVVGIVAASTAAAAFGLYVYWKYCRDPEVRVQARLNRNIFSVEECGSMQRSYLNEFKEDLGEKSFFLGDQMTSTDLKIFGQLASIYYVPKTETVVNLLNEDYPSLVAWLERVRQQICSKDFSKANQ